MRDNPKKNKKSDTELIDDTLLNVVSSTECTGMFYKPPMNDEESECYTDIYHGPEQRVTNLDENEQSEKKTR